jgi:Ca2+-transporting ATPase
VVVITGMNTEVGRIAGLLEAAEKEPTPLQQELDRTGKRLTVVMLGICAVVFAAGLFSTSTLTLNVVLSLFLFAVALAVAAIPEALPAIVTVGLSACAEWRQPTPSCANCRPSKRLVRQR